MEHINKKRVKGFAVFFAVMAVLLAARLAYIQIFCHDEFTAAAVSQYEITVEGLDTRGVILDRNSMPLTGGVKEYYYIISRKLKDGRLKSLTEDIGGQQIAKKTSAYLVYRTESFDRDINDILKKDYSAYVFQTSSRYSDDQLACHLIGYINEDEKVGVSGIELMCQDRLAAAGSRLTIWADAAGSLLRGIAPSVEDVEGSVYGKEDDLRSQSSNMDERCVVTTIDRRLQYVCEKALESHTKSGAALITDCQTGEILAWASSPTFDPNDIESYLEDGDCLINKVSQAAYAPGSVFKIVTAAAALENNVCGSDQVFECKGEVTVEGVTLGCSNAPEGGHGSLDMSQAMACSCNCYFAQLGEMIESGTIAAQAEKMGFGQTVLNNFPSETGGNIPGEDQVGPWDVSNLSIGQGDILATPLQINQMTSIIAGGGKLVRPTIFLDEEDTRKEKEEADAEQVVTPETAASIEMMLADVMTEGTGSIGWEIPVWGKTGTAEAEKDGLPVKNCWFTGYCRIEDKTYVITVLAEDGASGSATALPVFKEITEFLQETARLE